MSYVQFNISQPETCAAVQSNVSSACDIEGLYCFNVSYFNYTLFAGYEVDFPIAEVDGVLDSVYLTCANQTEIELCPMGYYCPDSWTKLICTPGHYCGYGFATMHVCAFGTLACPYSGMYNANQWALLFLFLAVLTVLLQIYSYLASKSIKYKEYKYKKYTTFDAVIQLSCEQENTVKFLGELNKSKSVRHILDNSNTEKSSRNIWSVDGSDSASLPSSTRSLELGVPSSSVSPASSVDGGYGTSNPLTVGALHAHNSGKKTSNSVSNQFANPVSGDFKFERIQQPLFVSFNDLNLYLKKNNAKVLDNVFGVIKPFHLTALMGPSGAGKTTLLALLRGQAHYARITGTMRVNGDSVSSLVPFREQMAFVPQDDILYEQLSVEDNILFSAILFNKRGYRKPSELLPMVYYAEEVLGIAFIRNSIVGSPEKKGISGGQKKRVSTAMEMMKEAALFFLDEPTSGLDSATSISLLHSLHQLSSIGVNIVATLHQPRQEILDLIDTLILLAPGGRLAYFGPPSELKQHFNQFGYLCPLNTNVADFVMDVLAGFMTPAGKAQSPPVKETIEMLCNHWQLTEQPLHIKYLENEVNEILSETRVLSTLHEHSNVSLAVDRQTKGFSRLQQLSLSDRLFNIRKTMYVSFSRQKKVYNRSFENIMGASYMLFGAGMVVGYILQPIRLNDANFQGSDPNIIFQLIVGQLSFGLLTLIWSLQLFSGDELMRAREEAGGVILFPLLVGKIIASYVELWFFGLAFVMGYYSTVEANATFLQYWGLYLLIHMCVSSIGNLLTLIVSGKKRDLISMGVLIVLWLFGGIQPAGPQLQTMIPVVGPFLNAISPFRWSFQIQMIIELSSYDEVWDPIVSGLYSEFAYHPSNMAECVGMLIFYWFFVSMLAYGVLVIKRDDFKVIRDIVDSLSPPKKEPSEQATAVGKTASTPSESTVKI